MAGCRLAFGELFFLPNVKIRGDVLLSPELYCSMRFQEFAFSRNRSASGKLLLHYKGGRHAQEQHAPFFADQEQAPN